MTNWKNIFLEFTSDVENHFDNLKNQISHLLHRHPLMIQPYLGYGNDQHIYLRGRVLKDKGIESAKDNDTLWQNLINTYKRYESDEIPHAIVRAKFGDHTAQLTADEEGMFLFEIPITAPLDPNTFMHPVTLELIDFPHRHHDMPQVQTVGHVIIPPSNAQFGVISDLDDTVVQTDVLNLLKLARNTFLRNAHTRLPFEGVAAFYTALRAGTNNTYNPIFYVSSSPWNIYDLIIDFFQVRGIPIGPLMLKNLGISPTQFIDSGHHAHKFKLITTILKHYPKLPFVLIGDSTQHDPEIYDEIARLYPQRIKAIYIRSVNPHPERAREILRIADSLKTIGIDLLLVPDTVGAAEDALLKGMITEEAIMQIRVERTEDQKPAEKIEQLLNPHATEQDLYDDPPLA
ncbi:MAG: DUF2183 domain-containing protein [Anaerolineae bacterium]|jgi:phosphatidate phosphatase APP1|nr:DUF2183 domain-containing protein [Anaerolineae bacterium]